jgi:hypothetical protein
MAKTIADILIEIGETQGELRSARIILRGLLEDQFGPLPEDLLQHIDAVDDAARLLQAARRAPRLARLEDLQL